MLANRLSEDEDVTVALIEAGYDDNSDHLRTDVPAR